MCICYYLKLNYCRAINYITFFIINLINSISGFLIMMLASTILSQGEKYKLVFNTRTIAFPALVLFGSLVMLLSGVYGCALSFRKGQQRIPLFVYAVILACLGIGELIAGNAIFTMRNTNEENLQEHFKNAIEKYDKDIDVTERYIDFIQYVLQCCGLDSYQDWEMKYNRDKPPKSCCKYTKNCHTEYVPSINEFGCMGRYVEAYKATALNCGIPIILFSVFHMLSSFVGFGLVYKQKQYQQREILDYIEY